VLSPKGAGRTKNIVRFGRGFKVLLAIGFNLLLNPLSEAKVQRGRTKSLIL